MLVAVFAFTLITAFIVNKLLNRQNYTSRENLIWKRLAYWGAMFFIGIVFNMTMYINNAASYKLSTFYNSHNLSIFIFILFIAIVIQIISPSISFDKFKISIKALKKRHRSQMPGEGNSNDEKASNTIDIAAYKKAKHNQIDAVEFQEKNFELFLNSLCWLFFSFVIFVNIYFMIMSFINSPPSTYTAIKTQLNHISCIMLLFTLPISFRQIFFYIAKIKKSTDIPNEEYNSSQYSKYMLIQNNLNKVHKRL